MARQSGRQERLRGSLQATNAAVVHAAAVHAAAAAAAAVAVHAAAACAISGMEQEARAGGAKIVGLSMKALAAYRADRTERWTGALCRAHGGHGEG